jgi:hypothetical protein
MVRLTETLDQTSTAVHVLMVTGNPRMVMPVAGMLAVPIAFVVALRDDTPGENGKGEQAQQDTVSSSCALLVFHELPLSVDQGRTVSQVDHMDSPTYPRSGGQKLLHRTFAL